MVTEMNEAGARLTLAEPLPSSDPDVEVTVVELASEEGASAGEGEKDGGGGGDEDGHEEGAAGAVVILDDADRARAEFERCGTSVSFICFRAANAVLRFTELSPAETRRIETALQSLQSEG